MNIFREIPPTAGFPLYARDFATLYKLREKVDYLEDDLRTYLNLEYIRITCSGTGALYLIMESIKDLSSKRTVIIPSYICPLVPLAIHRAGFKVRVCDIEKHDFNYNHTHLEDLCSSDNDSIAIIACHLAGIPIDMDAIKNMAKRYNLFVIEDCAQALGAQYKNKKVGSLGDFSFYSLCRGKGITTYEGGAVATNNSDYGLIIDAKIKKLVKENIILESVRILQLWGYWIFYRPQLFWFVFALPRIFWNLHGNQIKAAAEEFAVDFPIHTISNIRKLLGHATFYRLDEEIKKQRTKAFYYINELAHHKGIKVIEESSNTQATYPYVTVVFDDQNKQKKALKMGQDSGLGISQIYALAISDYHYMKDIITDVNCFNARSVAQRTITVSTSTFLHDIDLQSIIVLLHNV